jgi:hypothetical protein
MGKLPEEVYGSAARASVPERLGAAGRAVATLDWSISNLDLPE